MEYVICYDISDTKVRTKVAKFLETIADRKQYSVFVCQSTERKIRQVEGKLAEMTEAVSRKSIFITPVCQNCLLKSWAIGEAETEKPASWIF